MDPSLTHRITAFKFYSAFYSSIVVLQQHVQQTFLIFPEYSIANLKTVVIQF